MTADQRFMRRALALARRGCTTPNPMVGCLVVRDGAIVGSGWHVAAGMAHAEAIALAEAGDRAAGADVYVTLEPCAHHGRTPPCAPALVRARPARVVVAGIDPNPLVAGRGLDLLRTAGIATEVGVLEAESRRLNEAFFHFHATGRPLVTLKWAATLDGKIATRMGDSRWVTSATARRLVHRMRGRSGAVLVGVGTAIADDPLLTARLPQVHRQPLRVVIDPRLRLPEGSALLATVAAAPLLVCCGPDPPAGREGRRSAVRGTSSDRPRRFIPPYCASQRGIGVQSIRPTNLAYASSHAWPAAGS